MTTSIQNISSTLSTTKERNIGIDILRVLLALMVVIVHFNARGTGHVSSSVTWAPMKFFIYGMDSIVIPAVNIYVIVSGYFSFLGMRGYSHVFKSLSRLWLCLFFFSVGGGIFVKIVSPDAVAWSDFIERIFPITTGEWWYMSVYFATMLISPILNKMVDITSRREFFIILCSFLLTCSLLPLFNKNTEPLGVNLGYSFIWFIVLYLTGAGLFKHGLSLPRRWLLPTFFGLAFLNVLISFTISKVPMLKGYGFSAYNSITVYLQAIVLFLWFKDVKIYSKKFKEVIIFLSGLSLSVYIFHCQKDIGRLIWETLQPAQYADSLMLIPIFIVTVLGIAIVSFLIEYCRKKVFSIGGFEGKIINKITNLAKSIFNKSYSIVVDKICTRM